MNPHKNDAEATRKEIIFISCDYQLPNKRNNNNCSLSCLIMDYLCLFSSQSSTFCCSPSCFHTPRIPRLGFINVLKDQFVLNMQSRNTVWVGWSTCLKNSEWLGRQPFQTHVYLPHWNAETAVLVREGHEELSTTL